MRLGVDSVELYHVQIPLREPWRVGSVEVHVKDAIVLRVQTSRGVGWGESSWAEGDSALVPTEDCCWDHLCRRLIPAVLSRGEVELESFCRVMADLDGGLPAMAGLEMALWHAAAMARDVPLHVLLRGVARPIPSGLTVGLCSTVDELLDRIGRHLPCGYRRVKIAIRPGWDIEPVAGVRQQWPDLALAVDAGGAYRLDDLPTLRNLDKYGLVMIEQPMPADALDDSARLQAVLSTPIGLSTSVKDVSTVREIVRKQAGRILRIDLGRAGGFAPAMEIHDAACKGRLSCWLGTTPDLGIGAAAGLHLATLGGFVHPTDVGSSSRWFVDDLLEPPIVIDAGGYLHLPDGPGYGYRPNREKVEKYTIRHKILTA